MDSVINPSSTVCVSITDPRMTLKHRDLTVCGRVATHIIDRKGAENPIADNLSRLENVLDDLLPIDDRFRDEQLAVINASLLLHGMLIMLSTLLLNSYHLVPHTSKTKSFSMI